MRVRYYRKGYEKQRIAEALQARALASERHKAQQKRFVRRSYLAVLFLAPVLGYLFHAKGVVLGLIAFPILILFLISALIKRNGRAEVGIFILSTLIFIVFAIVGDLNNPPTALCADHTYSYSANNRGTCSWHGGIAQWGPPIWWERFLN